MSKAGVREEVSARTLQQVVLSARATQVAQEYRVTACPKEISRGWIQNCTCRRLIYH